MGRWKMGPQGGYYDANDSGPDQYSPTPAEAGTVGGPQAPAPTNQIPGDNQGPVYRPPYGRGPSLPGPMPEPFPGDAKMPPFEMFPGQGGGWFSDPGMKQPAATIEEILAKLREMWGDKVGAIGGDMHAGNPDHSMPQSVSPVARTGGVGTGGVLFDPAKRLPNTGINGGGSLLGGALGGLFGR